MESGPEFRIVGGARDKSVEKVLTDIDDAFSRNEGPLNKKRREFVLKHEIEKTPEIIEMIKYANDYTNKLLLQYGIEPYDIPSNKIHGLEPDKYSELETSGAAFSHPLTQMIVIEANSNLSKIGATLILIHEMLHLKGHKVLQIEDIKKRGPNVTNYRVGVGMQSSQSDENFHEHFRGLNESIVATIETRALQHTLRQPGYEEDKALHDDPDVQKYLSLLKTNGMKTDDITNIKKDGEGWLVNRTGYPRHREVLDFVVEKIFEDNTDIYKNAEDVYKLFFDAHFSGRILPIARLVEHSFGDSSFRILGNMNSDPESARSHLDTFKKLYRKNHS